MSAHALDDIPGLIRCENTARSDVTDILTEQTKTAYAHDEIFGRFVTVHDHIHCPPEGVYDYLANPRNLHEWTYSVRELCATDEPGLLVGWDALADDTKIYCRVESNADALTVDYHCAWDQGDELWMIYLYRVVSAELVLGKPGSVVVWTNCRHSYYDNNPYRDTVPHEGRPWVGDFWNFFHAGHRLELANLRAILEHRHHRGLPLSIDDTAEPA